MHEYDIGYEDALNKAIELCKQYHIEWRGLASHPAKITAACANNVIEFLCDDIEAHKLERVSNPSKVFRVGLGEADHTPPLETDLGSPERGEKKLLGSFKSFSRGFKKRRS